MKETRMGTISTKRGCSGVVNCGFCHDVLVFDVIILFHVRLRICFKCV